MSNNAALYFVDRHLSEGRADKTAFVEADGRKRSLTYCALAQQTSQFAGALTRAGIRREERMAMIVVDELEFPIAFWGALKAGVVTQSSLMRRWSLLRWRVIPRQRRHR